jgi:hypothetical protein
MMLRGATVMLARGWRGVVDGTLRTSFLTTEEEDGRPACIQGLSCRRPPSAALAKTLEVGLITGLDRGEHGSACHRGLCS